MPNPGQAPVLGVKKLVGKTVVDRGEPVPVTIQLKGDQRKLCSSAGIAVVLDVSGSLGLWHGEVKAAVTASLPLLSQGADRMSVGSFAGSFTLLQGWTTSTSDVVKALAQLSSGGSTSLTAAIQGANGLMASLPGTPQCRAALIVTDGQAGAPSTSLLEQAKLNGWKYTFLGVGNQDKKRLQDLATGSGGTYLDIEAAPFAGSLQGAITSAVTAFFQDALQIVAPSDIVLTEVANPALTVTAAAQPSVPPNQADPAAYTTAAGTAWAKLVTNGAATLPAIDRLDIDPSGARAEYSVDLEVTVDECSESGTTLHWVDDPTAHLTYSVPGFGTFTVAVPNLQIAVNPCALPVKKTWEPEDRIVTLEVKNNYSHTAVGVELLEVLVDPLQILRTSTAPLDGGAGHRHARFGLPELDPGDTATVQLWIAPSTPIPSRLGEYPVNDTRDSHVSFLVPFFAVELSPGTQDHATMATAIAQHAVTPAARTLLDDAAQQVPHASHMEVAENATLTQRSGPPWPTFGWEVTGDRGSFVIRQVGTSYAVHVVCRKWDPLPELAVPVAELDPR
ncbi:vWA domain-containing protein [Nocardioides sp. YIM 152588]|uniref:vWA domain-containing protein n=1 Tax=Nocardioides sp. YIM 152588 TaxID=3158259 RepID=UPI0032E51627